MEHKHSDPYALASSLYDLFTHDDQVFRALTETIPVVIYAYSGTRFVYVNKTFENTLGYSRAELVKMNFWEVCHPDYQDLIRERGLARLRGEAVPDHYEIKAQKKTGEIVWVDVFFSLTEMRGERISIVGAFDITERKQLEADLQQAREELEDRVQERTFELQQANQELTILNHILNEVMDNMSDVVALLRPDGKVELLNRSNDWDAGMLAQTLSERYKNDKGKQHNGLLYRLLHEGRTFRDEEIIITTHQDKLHFVVSGTPIVNEKGAVQFGVLILRPIDQVRQLVNRFSGAQATFKFDDIIYRSAAMQNTVNIAIAAARNQSTIVLEGESGTGKEMFAQAIHNAGNRSRGPFVAVNCGAIPRELIGSELFGYAEGAFTGAKKGGNPGKFELASEGTLFLDEIADMPLEQQVTLLRVIQEKKLIRIGGNDVILVDVRIICATNKNLLREVEQGNFRHDLYYRLNIINIRLPNLRERPEDIPLLFNYFVSRLLGYSWTATPGILDYLVHYSWPGNVRELQNVAERMVHLASSGQPDYEALLPTLLPSGSRVGTAPADLGQECSLLNYHQQQQRTRKEYEKKRILELIIQYEGNLSKVAKELGIARSTLYRKMHQYQIT